MKENNKTQGKLVLPQMQEHVNLFLTHFDWWYILYDLQKSFKYL